MKNSRCMAGLFWATVENMVVQRRGFHGREQTNSIVIKGSFSGDKNTAILNFRSLYSDENIIIKIIFNFYQWIHEYYTLSIKTGI